MRSDQNESAFTLTKRSVLVFRLLRLELNHDLCEYYTELDAVCLHGLPRDGSPSNLLHLIELDTSEVSVALTNQKASHVFWSQPPFMFLGCAVLQAGAACRKIHVDGVIIIVKGEWKTPRPPYPKAPDPGPPLPQACDPGLLTLYLHHSRPFLTSEPAP